MNTLSYIKPKYTFKGEKSMKNFEKPITAEVRELALRIMERAMFYNSTATKKEYTGDKPTFFVKFSGHTAALDVDIHKQGWKSGDEAESFTVYLSERGYNGTADEIQKELVSVIKRMEEVYTAWYEKEHGNE